jgi:ribosomal protein L13
MKKGTKITDKEYFLEIRELSHKPIHLASPISLREAVRVAAQFVPNMDTHSKVYREMRSRLGVYIGIFLVSYAEKPLHLVVTITTPAEAADIERFHALAETLPKADLLF